MKVGVNVIIPESTWGHSLAEPAQRIPLPVLWLQSGGGFDYTDWQRYTALELYASEAGVAVVCSGTYCSGYMDTYHGDFKYFSQLSIETPKVVRHLFPLSEKPEENFLAGFSHGRLRFAEMAGARPGAVRRNRAVFGTEKHRGPAHRRRDQGE